jgi:hypothetical protein
MSVPCVLAIQAAGAWVRVIGQGWGWGRQHNKLEDCQAASSRAPAVHEMGCNEAGMQE